MKSLILLFAVSTIFMNCTCRQIPINQYVLNTDNYGKDWRRLDKNETVPNCITNACRNLYLPATTMVGAYRAKFRVGGSVAGAESAESAKGIFDFTYQWQIVDPLKFAINAKELSGGGEYLTDESLEGIENKLVDKKIHDIAGPVLDKMAVKNFDPAEFEKNFTPELNKALEEIGVTTVGMGVVHEFGRALEEAIDNANALDFYRSIGEEELGRECIKNSAAATKIIINTDKVSGN